MTSRKFKKYDFIGKCIEKHGDKFNYSLVNYINNQTKVIIVCKIHGQFLQTPNLHLRGAGCPTCINYQPPFTREGFIKICKEVHGNKYDYSMIEYQNLKGFIFLNCLEHGEFRIQCVRHKNGRGCPKCSRQIRPLKARNIVISNFQKIHGEKYNYDKMVYLGSTSPVLVTCGTHGDFYVVPNSHLAGTGCPQCSSRVKTREEVITKFRSIHGLNYDYSEVQYSKSYIPVRIICRKHGVFEQAPESHWSGKGCPLCGRLKTNEALRQSSKRNIMPFAQVLEKFKEVHGEKYDYSLIKEDEYKTLDSSIPIQCSIHGVFYRDASAHKKGYGCPKCMSKLKDLKVLKQEFIAVHGDTYGYDKVKYKGYSVNVEIVCKKHGIFFQTPASHLRGAGCATCAKSHAQDFILQEFKRIHGDTYGYDRVVYKSLNEKVEIYCKKHKSYFWQTPEIHRKGSGCAKCCSARKKISQENIIARFTNTHGSKYDYSDTTYTGAKIKVKIRCRVHGDFFQLSSDHANGRGCPKCSILVQRAKGKERMKSKDNTSLSS